MKFSTATACLLLLGLSFAAFAEIPFGKRISSGDVEIYAMKQIRPPQEAIALQSMQVPVAEDQGVILNVHSPDFVGNSPIDIAAEMVVRRADGVLVSLKSKCKNTPGRDRASLWFPFGLTSEIITVNVRITKNLVFADTH